VFLAKNKLKELHSVAKYSQNLMS